MKNYTDKVLLFDGTALAYRSFYAFFKKPLRNSRGENVSAIFGVIKTIRHIDRIYKTEYIAFCFDAKGRTKRAELYPAYKATRQKIPDELSGQIPIIAQVINAMGFNFIEMHGYEADDIISSIAKQNDKKTIIISSDKDIAQIVDERINIATPSEPEIILDKTGITKKYGVLPSQIVDYLALVGDSSDNIPGVPGIGPKTASSLLRNFKNINEIYTKIDEIKSKKIKDNLLAYRKQLNLTRKLIKLNDKLNIGNISIYKRKKPNIQNILKILKSLELWSLMNEFSMEKEEQLSLFNVRNISENDIRVENNFHFQSIPLKDKISIFFSDEIVSICCDNSTRFYDKKNESIILSFITSRYKKILTNDAKRIYKYLFANRIDLNLKIDDIKIASSLIFGGMKKTSEKNILLEFISGIPYGKMKNSKEILYILSKNSLKVWNSIENKLNIMQLDVLYKEIELPLSEVLALMEYNGISVDTSILESIRGDFIDKIDELIQKCKAYTGTINLNSPKQLAKVLFEKLKLPVLRKTKTGYSTDNDTLKKLSRFHPLPSLLIDYREYMKFKTSYLDNLPSFIDTDNKIHTTFNQINVDTGRLSSNNPNLQNIPARSDEGKRLRKIFVANVGYKLVSFDYSQIELRIMAHMSGDKNLHKAFSNGLDIHKQTAALIFGVEESLVTSDMRRKAKVINFGIMYGMSPYGLSKELDISQSEAKKFIDNYFENYLDIKKWIEHIISFAKKNLYVKTLKGRIRFIPTINSKNRNEFEFAKRIAINTPIQGSAAELIKMAMIDIYKTYGNSDSIKMLLQIHDELIFEIKENSIAEIENIKNLMENTIKLNVPIIVTVGMGNSWYEASK